MALTECPVCGYLGGCYCEQFATMTPQQRRAASIARAAADDRHDPRTCPCLTCWAWRLNVTNPLDLDPDQNDQETPMPRLLSRTPAPNPEPDPLATSTCAACAAATPPPTRPPARQWDPDISGPIPPPPPVDPWPLCPTCTTILDGQPDARAGLVALAADALGLDLDPLDPDVRTAVVGTLPLARHQPGLSRLSKFSGFVPAEDGAGTGWAKLDAPIGRGAATRWAHLDEPARQRMTETIAEAQEARQPHRCSDGPCGACGVVEAIGDWTGPWDLAGDHRAPKWPLCADCDAIRERAGSLLDSTWRSHLTAAAFGARRALIGHDYLAGYWTTRDPFERPSAAPGCESRFGFITREERRRVYELWPAVAPAGWDDARRRMAAATAIVFPPSPERRPALDLPGPVDSEQIERIETIDLRPLVRIGLRPPEPDPTRTPAAVRDAWNGRTTSNTRRTR